MDNSDIVLKGDVVPTLKRNSSAVDGSYKPFKIGDFSHMPDQFRNPNNMRYGKCEDGHNLSDVLSSKNSPDMNKHTVRINQTDYLYKQQQDVIEKLQKEVNELKAKLQLYEDNCRCLNKSKHKSLIFDRDSR